MIGSATLALSVALLGSGTPAAERAGSMTAGKPAPPRQDPPAARRKHVWGHPDSQVFMIGDSMSYAADRSVPYEPRYYTGPRPYASHLTDLTQATTLEMAQEFSAMLHIPLDRFEGFAVADKLTPVQKAELLDALMRDNSRAARSVHYTDFDTWPRLRMTVWRGVLAIWIKDRRNPRPAHYGYTPPRGHA